MRQPLLDANLEDVHFYRVKSLQKFRLKRWDYYAVFYPQGFFSATIADLGYAGNIFIYILDYSANLLYEEGKVIPLGRDILLPRNSTGGESLYQANGFYLQFRVTPNGRYLSLDWPTFDHGRGIQAELELSCPPEHESMTVVIPIRPGRFYYNRKTNCMPATGRIGYGNALFDLQPDTALGSLDWGRGVWDYASYWNWASASGFLPDGRTIGLNFGAGFGDTSHATENCLVLDGCIHKLDQVPFQYDPKNYLEPWIFKDNQNRLDLRFVPFKERIATTNLGVIRSEVHQMFGRYQGRLVSDEGEEILLSDLVGFAEEHRARW